MATSQCRRLEGKVALVTAATAGIGLATAERLAEEGASVFICSRKQDNVDDAVKALRAKGLEVAGCACHVGSHEQRQRLVEQCVQKYGGLDVLVSNAAVNPGAGPISETTPDVVDKVLDINIKAAVLLVKEALPHLLRRPGSSIIFVSSVTAFNPPEPIGMYAVSKTALLGLTKGLAAELGPRGVRVNCVAPGIVPTKFSAALVDTPELAAQQAETTMLKRLGRPSEQAAAIAFLASPDAAYITGETLVVAGGMHSRL
ncbi:Dehydrogenase/reductase SDR family member 4 [Tetrabaena socialis]|uniref:Dehydrogenase/reductase SDR family member 4 n=1 Tax=Tetrabaena socialis TaxID=47790 RepID=A0A2J8AA76_9CHLO|nr:Dehydrogenase/reductase SDR family member 4 [Tetrabaena socialis]|eukprot:PNH09405.1 Dehydrogenase/reductase SDR family member 4 [Tetrabaena socialis]